MAIQITKSDIAGSGGLLAAFTSRSADYLRTLQSGSMAPIQMEIRRHIVHTDPHLDEYFAELLFRSCLARPPGEFIEQSIFSETNDFGAQQLWPTAVVFGIGRTVSPGVSPLILFDEHLPEGGKASLSCSDIVRKHLSRKWNYVLPRSVQPILTEVSAIDGYGHADAQHLGNLIKLLHDVRFVFHKGPDPTQDVRDYLSPTWKRAVVNACIVAVSYCLENRIDMIGNPDEKKQLLQLSLNHYSENCVHQDNPYYTKALQQIRGVYGNQTAAFARATLKNAAGQDLRDEGGNRIPQLLLMSRVCFAAHHCWGENIRDLLMMHLWEVEFQKQLNFERLANALHQSFSGQGRVEARTAVGVIRCETLNPLTVTGKLRDRRTGREQTVKASPWIINISPIADVFRPNQAASNYINSENSKCGLVLVENSYTGTKVLFRGDLFPSDKWTRLVQRLQSVEPDCWYDPSSDPVHPASFVLNGNKAHQYVPRSSLDFDTLGELARGVLLGK